MCLKAEKHSTFTLKSRSPVPIYQLLIVTLIHFQMSMYTVFAFCFVSVVSRARSVLVLWIHFSLANPLAWFLHTCLFYLIHHLLGWISKGCWLRHFWSSFNFRLLLFGRAYNSLVMHSFSLSPVDMASIARIHGKNLRLTGFPGLVFSSWMLSLRFLLFLFLLF